MDGPSLGGQVTPMQDPPDGANGSVAAVPSATGAFGGVAERFQVGKEWRAERVWIS